ncbi:MAG: MobA/MobL family protein, partial [Lachnospiraceae bacterium]|nr:MobA/MobL family protein [Lachnospiraceae bacterium]
KYDEHGNKIRKKNGRYDCTTVKTTDWDSKDNARKWRKDLVESINEMNKRLGNDEVWEWRSFKELGSDLKPTIHLGEQASALERKGIRTEKGDYNREVQVLNALNKQLKELEEYESENAEHIVGAISNNDHSQNDENTREYQDNIGFKYDTNIIAKVNMSDYKAPMSDFDIDRIVTTPMSPAIQNRQITAASTVSDTTEKKFSVKEKVNVVINEVLDIIHKAMLSWGKMLVPKAGAKYVALIKGDKKLSDVVHAESFVTDNDIRSFEDIKRYYDSHSALAKKLPSRIKRLTARKAYLGKLSAAYSEYAPLRDLMKERDRLSVISRVGFDKKHREEIDKYPKAKDRLDSLKTVDTKITPKAWEKEITDINAELSSLKAEYTVEVAGLATVEVIEFTRQELQRVTQIGRDQAYINGMLNQGEKGSHSSFSEKLEQYALMADKMNSGRIKTNDLDPKRAARREK